MSAVAVPRPAHLELEGRGLLIPSLHPSPLPLRRIAPAPCTLACPAGVNVKAYVSLIAERRFGEALEVIRRRCPLPGICGRICNHPCETACDRGKQDEPIAIRSLKRFVADLEREYAGPLPPPGPDRPGRVAVIGAGPAGLTAAYDLRLAGHPVTVFEAAPEAGGMLRYGITAYRLPREVLDAEIGVLARAGVAIRTRQRLGRDVEIEGLLHEGYAAVLLAVGAQLGRPLPVRATEHCPEVEDALEFLRRVNGGERTPPGRKVVVVGGGSTAVEAARASLRLGARSVEVLYRRYREEMLAGPEEIEVAESEGVAFTFLVAPSRVVSEGGRLAGLECLRVGLGEPDTSGRRRPLLIPGSEFVVHADRVLAAVGQDADLAFLRGPRRERLVKEGRLVVDPDTTMTDLPGVFAAGDAVSGPATVIEAIAAGHRAAESIRHFIVDGRPDIRDERPELRAPAEFGLPDPPSLKAMRVRPALAVPGPGREFGEVEQALSAEEAVSEARRCLRCGPCGECRICAPSCTRRHVMLRLPPGDGAAAGPTAIVRAPASMALSLAPDRAAPGWLLQKVRPAMLLEVDVSSAEVVELRPVRSHIVPDRCRGCARCVEVCPFHAVSLRANGTALGQDAPEVNPGASALGGSLASLLRPRTPVACIEPALCRGCNLCSAVCPTKAARPTALSPEWWGSRLEDVFHLAPARPLVVLACQRRAGALEAAVDRNGAHVEVVRFRCVGQVDAAMLLALVQLGARGVLVSGCVADRCRFGAGAQLAMEQVERARNVLTLLGEGPGRIACDWSPGRAQDPLDEPVRRFVEHGIPDGGRA